MITKVFCSAFFAFSFFFLFPMYGLCGIDRSLQTIPDSIVTVSSGYVIAVDKKHQKIHVFRKSSGFFKVFEANCSTGKNQGGKQVAGDARTPSGVFFATKILRNPGPPETYGTLAFPLDYPTMTDKKLGRNGANIWIHGTSKPIAPFQSNGCVVLNDRDIHALAKYIYLNKTPVIIAETISWVPQNQTPSVKTELEKVLVSWTKAYLTGNINAIDALYLRDYQLKGKKREQLSSQLSNINNINQHFILEPKDVSILRQNNEAVIIFDQITDIKKDNSFSGSFNKLALQKISNRWFIIDDGTMQTPAQNINRQTATAIRPDTDTAPSSKEAIQKLITLWAKSWQSGNMSAYRSCYMPDFRAQGKSLNAWVNHKINVRENSKNINIRVANLRISGNDNQATAIFTQHYSSNLLKSQGVKKLVLRKTNGKWKIYQETIQ